MSQFFKSIVVAFGALGFSKPKPALTSESVSGDRLLARIVADYREDNEINAWEHSWIEEKLIIVEQGRVSFSPTLHLRKTRLESAIPDSSLTDFGEQALGKAFG